MKEQSDRLFVPGVIKTNILLNDDLEHQDFLLQTWRTDEKLSRQYRLRKFCIDAGFLTTVEVGQYFMTKDNEKFSQFIDSVACREYTLLRDDDSSGNTKIGTVIGSYNLLPTRYIWSGNQKQVHEQTILTRGSEFLMALTNWSQTKAKAKPRRPSTTFARSSTIIIFTGERTWTENEPLEYSISDYSVSKKLINLLRHGSTSRR